MNPIVLFFETNQGKYVKNLLIGLGASIVLLGALFKIQHWQGGGTMLTIGMCTEAFIFAMLGLIPPHSDYYWERFYPAHQYSRCRYIIKEYLGFGHPFPLLSSLTHPVFWQKFQLQSLGQFFSGP